MEKDQSPPFASPATDLFSENERLKVRLKESALEKEILKKLCSFSANLAYPDLLMDRAISSFISYCSPLRGFISKQECLLRFQTRTRQTQQPQPAPGLILHSDRGGQYVSERFRRLIKLYSQSMRRKSDS
ncbi:MAG: hypothetical protein H7Y04_13155 [Verrucomicrobia bacterium]|nr:hypothetical protein [Cytophagales bacterium]